MQTSSGPHITTSLTNDLVSIVSTASVPLLRKNFRRRAASLWSQETVPKNIVCLQMKAVMWSQRYNSQRPAVTVQAGTSCIQCRFCIPCDTPHLTVLPHGWTLSRTGILDLNWNRSRQCTDSRFPVPNPLLLHCLWWMTMLPFTSRVCVIIKLKTLILFFDWETDLFIVDWQTCVFIVHCTSGALCAVYYIVAFTSFFLFFPLFF